MGLTRCRLWMTFAFISPMLLFMTTGTTTICDFVIRCKGCETSVPAPVRTLPDTWIVVTCPVCGAREQYLSTEIFRGRVSFDLLKKPACSAVWW
jgi:hypothetical protein